MSAFSPTESVPASIPKIFAGCAVRRLITSLSERSSVKRSAKGNNVSSALIPASVSPNGASFASASCGSWSEQIALRFPVASASISASRSRCVRKGGRTWQLLSK